MALTLIFHITINCENNSRHSVGKRKISEEKKNDKQLQLEQSGNRNSNRINFEKKQANQTFYKQIYLKIVQIKVNRKKTA